MAFRPSRQSFSSRRRSERNRGYALIACVVVLIILFFFRRSPASDARNSVASIAKDADAAERWDTGIRHEKSVVSILPFPVSPPVPRIMGPPRAESSEIPLRLANLRPFALVDPPRHVVTGAPPVSVAAPKEIPVALPATVPVDLDSPADACLSNADHYPRPAKFDRFSVSNDWFDANPAGQTPTAIFVYISLPSGKLPLADSLSTPSAGEDLFTALGDEGDVLEALATELGALMASLVSAEPSGTTAVVVAVESRELGHSGTLSGSLTEVDIVESLLSHVAKQTDGAVRPCPRSGPLGASGLCVEILVTPTTGVDLLLVSRDEMLAAAKTARGHPEQFIEGKAADVRARRLATLFLTTPRPLRLTLVPLLCQSPACMHAKSLFFLPSLSTRLFGPIGTNAFNKHGAGRGTIQHMAAVMQYTASLRTPKVQNGCDPVEYPKKENVAVVGAVVLQSVLPPSAIISEPEPPTEPNKPVFHASNYGFQDPRKQCRDGARVGSSSAADYTRLRVASAGFTASIVTDAHSVSFAAKDYFASVAKHLDREDGSQLDNHPSVPRFAIKQRQIHEMLSSNARTRADTTAADGIVQPAFVPRMVGTSPRDPRLRRVTVTPAVGLGSPMVALTSGGSETAAHVHYVSSASKTNLTAVISEVHAAAQRAAAAPARPRINAHDLKPSARTAALVGSHGGGLWGLTAAYYAELLPTALEVAVSTIAVSDAVHPLHEINDTDHIEPSSCCFPRSMGAAAAASVMPKHISGVWWGGGLAFSLAAHRHGLTTAVGGGSVLEQAPTARCAPHRRQPVSAEAPDAAPSSHERLDHAANAPRGSLAFFDLRSHPFEWQPLVGSYAGVVTRAMIATMHGEVAFTFPPEPILSNGASLGLSAALAATGLDPGDVKSDHVAASFNGGSADADGEFLDAADAPNAAQGSSHHPMLRVTDVLEAMWLATAPVTIQRASLRRALSATTWIAGHYPGAGDTSLNTGSAAAHMRAALRLAQASVLAASLDYVPLGKVKGRVRVIWDTFCGCSGWTNEVAHFIIPLAESLQVHASNEPACFCSGFTADHALAIHRLALTKSFLVMFESRFRAAGQRTLSSIDANATIGSVGAFGMELPYNSQSVGRRLHQEVSHSERYAPPPPPARLHHNCLLMPGLWSDSSSDDVVVFVSHKDPGSYNSFPTASISHSPDAFVGRSMYEFAHMPPAWLEHTQRRDLKSIWVPSHHVKKVFSDSRVERNLLRVVPEAVDVHQYSPAAATPLPQLPRLIYGGSVAGINWRSASTFGKPQAADSPKPDANVVEKETPSAKDPFLFLSIAKWEDRKGFDVLLDAFFREFCGDARKVALVIVTYRWAGVSTDNEARDPNGLVNLVRVWAKRHLRSLPSHCAALRDRFATSTIASAAIRDVMELAKLDETTFSRNETVAEGDSKFTLRTLPPVLIITERLTEEEIVSLYGACNAYVSATRGEGWGLPMAQGMSMGLPVIATNWSGQLTFMATATPSRCEEQFSAQFVVPEAPLWYSAARAAAAAGFPVIDDGSCSTFKSCTAAKDGVAFKSKCTPVSILFPINDVSKVQSDMYGKAFEGKDWANPSGAALQRAMRWVSAYRNAAAMIGSAARHHMTQAFSESAVAQSVLSELSDLRKKVLQERASV